MTLLEFIAWKYNGKSEENIKNITKSDSNFAPTFVNHHLFPGMNFNCHCLINNNITKHSNCGTEFDSHSEFSFVYETAGKNVIVFGADMSSSVHIDKK